MPTLYDNFERVRQYIDQHQGGGDMSAYVTKDELSAQSYITNEVTQLDGPLFISYQTANNGQYTLNAYSHIIAGTEDKTGLSLIATKRKCGGDEGTSYMASFFTNSDGRSKFAHKTKVSGTEVGGQADDAFMCFNAYGFRIAYSGTEGVSANTEYEILHEGNIGNLGYVTKDELSAQSYLTSIPSTYASYNGVYSYLNSIGIYKKNNGGSNIDSAYITDSELSGDIVINGISTWELPTYAAISDMGYITSIPSEYVTDTELSSALGNYYTDGEVDAEISSALSFYYTKTEINNASYVTSSDLPVIDENIIPKETGTYTLGDVDHMYKAAYSSGFYTRVSNLTGFENNGNYTGIYVRVGGNNKLDINSNDMRPVSNKNYNLGATNNWYGKTYTDVLFTNTAYLQDTSYTKSIVPAENAAYTLGSTDAFYRYAYIQTLRGLGTGFSLMIGTDPKFDFYGSSFRPRTSGNINLGGDQYKWAYTYTKNLILNGTNIEDRFTYLIWTGTSAEYAALDNYTSYQIYLIQEA